MGLRAHDHYTSSTLIGGKDGAGPSSLHTTLEGPTKWAPTSTYDLCHEPDDTILCDEIHVSLAVTWDKFHLR